MSVRCHLVGHDLDAGTRVDGQCERLRLCRRCSEQVVAVAHRLSHVSLDPAVPCLLTRQCEDCGVTVSTMVSHDWSSWELEDAARNEFSRYCHTPGCGATERKHEHQWETTTSYPVGQYDDAVEATVDNHYEERTCTLCHEKETVEV